MRYRRKGKIMIMIMMTIITIVVSSTSMGIMILTFKRSETISTTPLSLIVTASSVLSFCKRDQVHTSFFQKLFQDLNFQGRSISPLNHI